MTPFLFYFLIAYSHTATHTHDYNSPCCSQSALAWLARLSADIIGCDLEIECDEIIGYEIEYSIRHKRVCGDDVTNLAGSNLLMICAF